MLDLSVSSLVLSFHLSFIQYYSPARMNISMDLSADILNNMSKVDKNCTKAPISVRLPMWQLGRFWRFVWNMYDVDDHDGRSI